MMRTTSFLLTPLLSLALSLAATAPLAAQGGSGYLGRRALVEAGVIYNPFFHLEERAFTGYRYLPGVTAVYQYAYADHATVGGGASFQTFGRLTPTIIEAGGRAKGLPVRTTAVYAQWANYGRRVKGVAPLGFSIAVSLGVVASQTAELSGYSNAGSSYLYTAVRRISPRIGAGFGYAYLLRERYTFRPFCDLVLSGQTFAGLATDDVGAGSAAYSNVLQVGLKFGMLR